ncbi:substrate-binding domain-containing protein [Paractinoplanes ferrugineus]|uniref:Sugar ABC transporter substrate-binding protein n=1 Tax=Paractinoplanes ferrugineus TaxID=113564 RepID=A0A919J3G9_9ACTN|nr:substrate-binding domain-containing protein [Actinoplanes ferrugineus]GIE12974.1 sugar ABC transporter substrate-binding protein [Actinoplanes ferrugineus]
MRKKLLALATVGLLATATMTACDDSDQSSDAGSGSGNSGAGSGKARVGVILPDTKSSQRWKTDDPKFLKASLDAAGIPSDIQNAQGDRANFIKIGEEMINTGVKVLIIANLDSDSAKAVIDKAKEKKVPVIDYDRLTLNGGADYYVSFDNEQVGKLQAYGLIDCLKKRNVKNPVIAELNGSRSDNNATLFKNGYDQLLQPKYDSAEYTQGPDQYVPDWDADEAGRIFTQMLEQQPKIAGVLAANDGLGGAAIEVLRKKKLNGKVPVTGQDATVQGLQNILTGDQCLTVYKAIEPEAEAAGKLAAQLFKGEKPAVSEQLKDPESGAYVPFVKLQPNAITIDKVKDVVASGFVTKKELCTGKYAALCEENGVGVTPKPNKSSDDNN